MPKHHSCKISGQSVDFKGNSMGENWRTEASPPATYWSLRDPYSSAEPPSKREPPRFARWLKNLSGFSDPLIFSKFSGNYPLIHPIIFSPSGSPSLIFFAFRVQHPLFFWLRELYPLKIFVSGCKIWVANSRDPLIPLHGSSMQGYWRWNPPVPAKTQVPEVESLSTCQNAGTGGSTSGPGG